MIKVYTEPESAQRWLERYGGRSPIFVSVLGFTATGLLAGISAAGATPEDRKYTAVADAEFLVNGVQKEPTYPLPPLQVGVSPVFISRAVIEAFSLPVCVFNAGLPLSPTVAAIDLGGVPAQCITTGKALPLFTVKALFKQGLYWGEKLAQEAKGYLLISECVVGGTTTALALLTGLGIDARGKVNSSHPCCNHEQKWEVVQAGLQRAGFLSSFNGMDAFDLVAAVGDPMQVVVAGMAIAASRITGVLLAGGTQMLAVYALMKAIAARYEFNWQPEQVVVGTTRWVAEDATGDTVGLARAIGNVPLIATSLSFTESCYPQLRAYELGYVKEGVGAGGGAIAASLASGWTSVELLSAIESLVARYYLLH